MDDRGFWVGDTLVLRKSLIAGTSPLTDETFGVEADFCVQRLGELPKRKAAKKAGQTEARQ